MVEQYFYNRTLDDVVPIAMNKNSLFLSDDYLYLTGNIRGIANFDNRTISQFFSKYSETFKKENIHLLYHSYFTFIIKEFKKNNYYLLGYNVLGKYFFLNFNSF